MFFLEDEDEEEEEEEEVEHTQNIMYSRYDTIRPNP